jgi:hypothetical protein
LELVKLHPKQSLDLTVRNFQDWGVWPVQVVQHTNVRELLMACHFAVMNLSQAGWETLYIGKPLIVLDHYREKDVLAGSYHMFPFLEDGTAIIVRDAAELAHAVDRLLFDDDFYKTQLDKIHKFQERAYYGRGRPVGGRLVEILLNKHVSEVAK